MEKKVVTTNQINEKLVLDKHFIFEYKCDEKKVIGSKIELHFSRDDEVPYIEELRKLENEYGEYKIGSMIPMFIFPAVSFILFTVFVILYFLDKAHGNTLIYFLSLALPGILSLIGAFLFMFFRTRKIGLIEKEKPQKDEEFKQKVAKLK